MKINALKSIAIALGFGLAAGVTGAQAAVVVVESPRPVVCTYHIGHPGYAVCRKGFRTFTVYASKSVKVCTPHGCYWKYYFPNTGWVVVR